MSDPSGLGANVIRRWKAQDITSSNGTAISSAPDSSGNNHPLSASGGARPTVQTVTANGKTFRVLRFDGATDRMTDASLDTTGNFDAAFIFAVYGVSAVPGSEGIITDATTPTSNNGSRRFIGVANTIRWYSGTSVTGPTTLTGWHVIAAAFGNSGKLRYDGTAYTGDTGAIVPIGTFVVGSDNTSGRFLAFDLAELIVCDAVPTDAQVAEFFDTYAQDTYGVSVTDYLSPTTTLSPTGLASVEAFGSPTVTRGAVTSSPTGIASVQAFGSPTVTVLASPTTLSPAGIGSAQVFGTPRLVGTVWSSISNYSIDTNQQTSLGDTTPYRYVILQEPSYAEVAAIKAANPKTKVLAYMETPVTQIHTGTGDPPPYEPHATFGVNYRYADTYHPEWFLHVSGGARAVYTDFTSYAAMDIGNVDYQNQYAANMITALPADGFDGIWMDDVNTFPGHGLNGAITEYTDAQYGAAMAAFVANVAAQLRAAGLIVAANVACNPWTQYQHDSAIAIADDLDLYNREQYTRYGGISGPWSERFNTTADQGTPPLATMLAFDQEVQAAGARLSGIDYGQTTPDATTVGDMTYGRAAFLLAWDGKEGGAYIFRRAGVVDPAYPEWMIELGTPTSSAVLTGSVFSRSYSNGLVYLNPSPTSSVSVDVPAGYVDADGSSVSGTVTLPLETALVLKATAAVTLSPTGIGSGGAFGAPAVTGVVQLSPAGIGSLEAVGTPAITNVVQLGPAGIGSLEAVGSPTIVGASQLIPAGIGSLEAVGTPAITGAVQLGAVGIGSLEAVGTPAITNVVQLGPDGIGSLEAVGVPSVAPGGLVAAPAGIDSLEAVGVPSVAPGGLVAAPAAVGTAQAFGSPTVVSGTPMLPAGIVSAGAFGTPTVALGGVQVGPAGVVSVEAFGSLSLLAGAVETKPSGVVPVEAFGVPDITLGGLEAAPAGVDPAEAFGELSALATLTAVPAGVASAEAFGAVLLRLTGPRDVTMLVAATLHGRDVAGVLRSRADADTVSLRGRDVSAAGPHA